MQQRRFRYRSWGLIGARTLPGPIAVSDLFESNEHCTHGQPAPPTGNGTIHGTHHVELNGTRCIPWDTVEIFEFQLSEKSKTKTLFLIERKNSRIAERQNGTTKSV